MLKSLDVHVELSLKETGKVYEKILIFFVGVKLH